MPTPHIQTSFNAGEISPQALGRSDLTRYQNSLALCENMIVKKQGNVARRPGTRFVAEVKDSSKLTILYPFRVSNSINYIVEIGDAYARFYTSRAQLLGSDGSTPVEVTTPWAEADLRELKFIQSADILYCFHPDYETREIQRVNPVKFQIRKLGAINGPYLDRNTTSTKLTTSALTGSVTVTADDGAGTAQVTNINDDRGFLQGDVDRQIRWQESASSGKVTWLTITAVPSETSITGITQANPAVVTAASHGLTNGQIVYIKDVAGMTDVNDRAYTVANKTTNTFELSGEDSSGYTAYSSGGTCQRSDSCTASVDGSNITSGENVRKTWSMGSWSDTTGWPRCGVFHQGRLWAAGTSKQPQGVWSSLTGQFDDWSPTDASNTVPDDYGIARTIDANEVQNIYHMHSHARGLLVMTDGGEWVGGTSGGAFDPLTPSNFGLLQQGSIGSSANVHTWQAGNAVLFLQASGNKVREFVYQFEADQFIANDLTLLAEHVIDDGDGAVDSAYQEEPDPILWFVRTDGQLAGLTYDRSQKIFGWHRHILGGSYLGGDAVVESCAVIRDDPDDLLWLVVKRTINGSTERHIEYVGDEFTASDNDEEAFFMDAGLASVDKPELITAATQANPVHITATITGVLAYGNGTSIKIRDVEGMTELNGNTYTVANSSVSGTTHDFDLSGTDGTGFGAYTKGGTVRNVLSSVSGMDHLEAETVKVAGDGAEQADQTVSSGSITLATSASIVYVGLQNTSKIVSVPLVPAQMGFDPRTSKLRAAQLWLMMHRSQGGTAGVYGENLDSIEYDDATTLFTGVKQMAVEGANALRTQIEIDADSIQPLNILQIGVEIHGSPT